MQAPMLQAIHLQDILTSLPQPCFKQQNEYTSNTNSEIKIPRSLPQATAYIHPNVFTSILLLPVGQAGGAWDLREIGWDGMDWIDLAQDRDQWRTLVNAVMSLRVP
jgi:hypothetical protein